MIFYVDGACSGNGTDNSSGAFGVVGINDKDQMFYWFYDPTKDTTNNREELKAILHVMRHFGMEDEVPIVYSDSAYSVNTYNDWMFKWSQNNWKKADGNTPENLDLIREYYRLYQQGYRIDLQKIKGHAGNKWNEFVDKLAKGIDVFTDKPVRGQRREVGIIDE